MKWINFRLVTHRHGKKIRSNDEPYNQFERESLLRLSRKCICSTNEFVNIFVTLNFSLSELIICKFALLEFCSWSKQTNIFK